MARLLNPFFSFIILCQCYSYINSQVAEKLTVQNPCVSKAKCHECIQTPSCAWCYSPTFGQRPRCFQPSSPSPQGAECPEEYIWNPDNVQQLLIAKELSKAHSISGSAEAAAASGSGGGGASASSSSSSSSSSYSSSSSSSWSSSSSSSSSSSWSSSSEIVQVSPQRVNLKLRAGQSYSLTMHYTQAEDYPVDLYYLMDLSKSMEDDKEKLSKLGNLLAETMSNMTSNFRLGFGSFVDKVVMPYVSMVPSKLKQPCQMCEAPYGFRNHMTLSTNTSQFSQMVKDASVSGNLDAPEGGFDAIMQAIVCRQEIGWREKARRLLVFSTDAGFHYAGDGKLGGIITPNDGECHLDNGIYTHSKTLDYPSISQINLKVKQNAINVIFAVTESQIHIYKQLQEHIEGASSGQLSNDSSNIVELVKNQYEQISSTVEMKDNATGSLKINYYSQCLNSTGPEKKTNKCGNIKVGDIITFKVEIELTSCPKDPKDWNQVLQIYPVGLNESLIVSVEMLCACPCEIPGNPGYEEGSPMCNHKGTYMCGICECYKPHFGWTCECSESAEITPATANTTSCRPNNETQLDCSGRGTCTCNRCECNTRANPNEKISGDYCECDNFSCDRHEGKLCSGPTHGRCDCGVCLCNAPWGGPACDCKLSNDTCFAPDAIDGKICSGHGECVCGACRCESTDKVRYSGRFCEKCPTCSDRCEEFRDCVQCQIHQTGPLKDKEDCISNCTKFTPIGVKHIDKNKDNDENLCTFLDEDDCRFYYVYYFDEQKKIVVKAEEDRECPPKVILTGIIFGVIAAIVLMGLAILLLWKLLTTIHDRREFAKFEKERMMARWDASENPIYKQATSTFKNPTYAGKG